MKFALIFIFLPLLLDTSSVECGVYRNKRMNDNLFYDFRVLWLNCDKTFSYRHSGCINPDTAFGIWNQVGDLIVLKTTKKLKKLVKKGEETARGYAFVDLNNESITIYDSFLVWKRTDKFWTDTLYKK